jgi:stalled ribosome alternative rescue factor ArfA
MRKVLSEKEVIKIIEEKLPELIEKYPLLRLKIEEIIERKGSYKRRDKGNTY